MEGKYRRENKGDGKKTTFSSYILIESLSASGMEGNSSVPPPLLSMFYCSLLLGLQIKARISILSAIVSHPTS